jgi:hypothetical protein
MGSAPLAYSQLRFPRRGWRLFAVFTAIFAGCFVGWHYLVKSNGATL